MLLKTFGHVHRWAILVEGPSSRLHHHSFGCYSQDLKPLRRRVAESGITLLDPPVGFDDGDAFWFRDPEGILIEVRVAPKTSLDHKNSGPGCPALRASPEHRPAVRHRSFIPSSFLTSCASLPISIRRSPFIHVLWGCDFPTGPTPPSCMEYTAAIITS